MSAAADHAPVHLESIGQIHINAEDLARATAFYRDVLGLQFLFEVPNMAFFRCGDVRLMIGVAEKPELAHPASIIYYKVDDIEATHRALEARGVAFEQAPVLVHKAEDHDLWLAFLRDSEANMLALMSEVPRSTDGGS